METEIDTFKKQKYVYVKKALPESLAGVAAQYGIFDSVVDFQADLAQVKGAHSKYGDSLMEALLLYLRPAVEKATGLTLYPTYSFYRTYKVGDELKKHVDRPACEISVSVCLGFSYDNNDPNYSWVLWVGETPFRMEVGDMAVYRGLEVVHWREPFEGNKNSWQVQAFLHYVDANGPYAFLKNDTRPAVGLPAETRNSQVSDIADEIQSKQEAPSFVYLTRE
jgi:hypothetical protein